MSTPASGPVVSGCILTVRYTVAGQEAINVLGGKWDGAPAVNVSNANAWLANWWTPIRATLPSAVVCQGATLRDLSVEDGLAVDASAPASPQGADSGTLTVAAAGGVIHWRTTQGGRSGRGRTFLPGLGEADVDSDGRSLASAMQTRIATAISTYLTGWGTGGVPIAPAVVSRRLGTAAPITSGAVASIVGIQRRRMR